MDATAADAGSTEQAAAAPAPRARRAPYRRLSVAKRREQLIAVALELFSRHAPEEVSLDEVATAAGASRPLVYRYFPGGKQQLYEAALRSAADELGRRFVVPPEGPPTERLAHALDRYFAFVGEHAAGYGALLRGGSSAENARTSAIVDDVRRGALAAIVGHLDVTDPGPRLTLLVRSWIAVVETAALSWLDDSRRTLTAPGLGSVEELCGWLVDQFTAMLAVTALHDPQTADALRGLVASHPEDGARLMAGVAGVLAPAGG